MEKEFLINISRFEMAMRTQIRANQLSRSTHLTMRDAETAQIGARLELQVVHMRERNWLCRCRGTLTSVSAREHESALQIRAIKENGRSKELLKNHRAHIWYVSGCQCERSWRMLSGSLENSGYLKKRSQSSTLHANQLDASDRHWRSLEILNYLRF
jgi:hypothetical protein